MLILSRKQDEKIAIGDVTVTILRLSRGRVTIGIEAPKEVQVSRQAAAKQRE